MDATGKSDAPPVINEETAAMPPPTPEGTSGIKETPAPVTPEVPDTSQSTPLPPVKPVEDQPVSKPLPPVDTPSAQENPPPPAKSG